MPKPNRVWMRMAAIAAVTMVIAGFSLTDCARKDERAGGSRAEAKPGTSELSAWIVDWQWPSGMEDFQRITDGLSEVQAFAAYFDESDRLLWTKEALEGIPEIIGAAEQSGPVKVNLTVVNDVIRADGTESQKDPKLISRLMATDKSRKAHIADIMKAAGRFGFRGVEIDYEQIPDGDWNGMSRFYQELYDRLRAEGKSLRIVLEPGAPLERLKLPEGPVYVMMAYNLYGTHSGPGPKADRAFIGRLAARMDKLPGDNAIALSAGGFDWTAKGGVAAVTEEQASALADRYRKTPDRDDKSGSLYFTYKDDAGRSHTVWYADGITLADWIGTARKAGYDKISLWRLGDLGGTSLKVLNGGGIYDRAASSG